MTRTIWMALLAMAVLFGAPKLWAGEASADEAKEAAEEEKAQKENEAKYDRPMSSMIVGTLDIKSKELRGDGKGVVGTLTAKSGKIFQIKLTYPELGETLEKFNGKRVRLTGNARNKGKYFLAQEGQLALATDKDS